MFISNADEIKTGVTLLLKNVVVVVCLRCRCRGATSHHIITKIQQTDTVLCLATPPCWNIGHFLNSTFMNTQ